MKEVVSPDAECEILFLGGIFTVQVLENYVATSKGVIQFAADALQKNIIQGLRAHCSVRVVNLPFLGSHPRLSPDKYIVGSTEHMFGTTVIGQSFNNRRVFRIFSRFVASFAGLFRHARSDQVVLVYSAHFPFLVAAVLLKLIRHKVKICLILPDLPEHMGLSGPLSIPFRFTLYPLSTLLIKRFDRVIGLTQYVEKKIRLKSGRFMVMEGIANVVQVDDSLTTADISPQFIGKTLIFYSGTLAARYGIRRLLDAVRQMRNRNASLIVCGHGDAVEDVRALALVDSRIVYLGQLPREEAVAWQGRADILVNPRVTEDVDDYTYYSFPSKIMEYMASGTAVVMNKLAGIPDEYTDYFFAPADNSASSLAECLDQVCAMSAEDRRSFGAAAREFVRINKNPTVQAGRIYNHIFAD